MTTPPRTLEYVPVDELPEDPRNPKLHDQTGILSSISRFGFIEPTTVDGRTGFLISGHGRKEALRALRDEDADPPDGIVVDEDGTWRAPLIRGWSSTDDAEAGAALVALNRLVESGGFDQKKVLAILDDLVELNSPDVALEGTGFSYAELDDLRAAVEVPDFKPTDPDGQPRLDQKNPVVCPECSHEWVP